MPCFPTSLFSSCSPRAAEQVITRPRRPCKGVSEHQIFIFFFSLCFYFLPFSDQSKITQFTQAVVFARMWLWWLLCLCFSLSSFFFFFFFFFFLSLVVAVPCCCRCYWKRFFKIAMYDWSSVFWFVSISRYWEKKKRKNKPQELLAAGRGGASQASYDNRRHRNCF